MQGGFSLPRGIMCYLVDGPWSFSSLTPRGLGLACERSGFEAGVSSDPCAHTLHGSYPSSPYHCQPLHFCLGCVPLEMPFPEDHSHPQLLSQALCSLHWIPGLTASPRPASSSCLLWAWARTCTPSFSSSSFSLDRKRSGVGQEDVEGEG